MEEKDLIKKLEKIELPEIEIPSHKEKLKSILESQYLKEKKGWGIFPIREKILIPAGTIAVIILIVSLISNLIFPQYTLAQVEEIALKNPQIKELIEKGAEIKDIKIIKDKGYVLVGPKEAVFQTKQLEEGALVEINLRAKKVSRIDKITPQVSPLTEEDKENVKKTIEKLGEPEITEIKAVPSFPQKLIEKDKKIEVLPEKRASVIYKIGEKQWEGRVNLQKEIMESTKFLGKIKE